MHNAVAIVFVATDEAHVLIPALESLEKNPTEHPLQIVVVDNASTDGMAAEVRRRWPHIPVLPHPYRRGLPANLNTGIRATSAPFVMLCNPDLTFPELFEYAIWHYNEDVKGPNVDPVDDQTDIGTLQAK